MSQNHLPNGPNRTNGEAASGRRAPATLELAARVAPANDTAAVAVPANDTGAVAAVMRGGPLGLPRTYWTLWVGMLLNRLGGAVFFLLGLYLTRERGLPAEVAGLIISLHAAGGLFAGPLGGALADRFGRRATLLAGTACAGTLMLALGLARSTAAIAVLAPLLGFATIACMPPLQAAVADVVPAGDRKRAYGLLYWAVNLGFAGASAFGGALAERHFTLLFVIDALTTYAYGIIVFFGVPETRPVRVAPAGPRATPGFFAPFRDAPFVKFVLVQALLLVAFAQVIVALPLDMRARGISLPHIGWLLGLNGVYIVLAQPLALRFARGRSHVQWLVAGGVLTGVGLGGMALVSGVFGYVVTGIVWTLGEVGWSTAGPAIAADLAPAERRGAYQGTYALAWGTSSMLAPIVGTFVLARLGAPALWLGCLAVSFAAAALHLRIARGR
jgi:MFS family permease